MKTLFTADVVFILTVFKKKIAVVVILKIVLFINRKNVHCLI